MSQCKTCTEEAYVYTAYSLGGRCKKCIIEEIEKSPYYVNKNLNIAMIPPKEPPDKDKKI